MTLVQSPIILGIESSCDETAVAVLQGGQIVKSSIIASQIETHKIFGGVVPEVASRSHLNVIAKLFDECIRESGLVPADLDAIAVTQGPGLIGSLLVGATFAKGLGLALGIPIIPVNHVHAHVHGALLSEKNGSLAELFPCLALVVSGGHTHIYRMDQPTHFALLAFSLDDACGESFDKVAKLLGLAYPGGPQIEVMARQGIPGNVKMPKMIEAKGRPHLSYSGLKTFVYTWLQQQKQTLSEQQKCDLAFAFQEEALGQICRKTHSALSANPAIKSIVVAGGVAANQRFQSMMKQELANQGKSNVRLIFPELKYCSDNAAMIAALGYHLSRPNGTAPHDYSDLSWDAFPRYLYPENS